MNSVTVVTYVYKDSEILGDALSTGLNIVVFCTKGLFKKVDTVRKNYKDKTIIIIKEINELEIYNEHLDIINEKNVDIDICRTFNKTSFIRNIARANPFKTSHFVWSDVENLSKLAETNIHQYLGIKVKNIEEYIIVPQNLAWHYRYLISDRFYTEIYKNKTLDEKAIYASIQLENSDIVGDEETTYIKAIPNKISMVAVIARYNEDISWTKKLRCGYIIYNKNEEDSGLFRRNLPNVGREGHTFFTYIIENYNNLPDFVCFLHGVPFDHCSNIIDTINNFDGSKKFRPLSASYYLHSSEYERTYKFAEKIGLSLDKSIKMIASCQCIISKELILKNPKSIYQMLLDSLAYHVHPKEAYIIENLWPSIFNFNKDLIPSCDDCRGYWGGC